MTTKKKAVAKRKSQNLATTDIMKQMAADAGKGIEQADKDSFAIPFILCLQTNSPQLETVDGAKAGMFINSVTNELYEKVRVVPVFFIRQMLRWVDRDAGGGFKGAFTPLEVEEFIANGEARRSSDGLTIRIGENESFGDTRQHYVLVQSANGAWTPAVVACASTQISKSKTWLTQINNFQLTNPVSDLLFNPPAFSRIYEIASRKESNAKGSWYGITIKPDTSDENPDALTWVEDPTLYPRASRFYDKIVAGNVKVQHEDLNKTDTEQSEEGMF